MLQITHETPAAERIRKARTALLLDHPFFGSLLFRLKSEEDRVIPTMATNGIVLRYNSAFVDTLNAATLAGVLAHEVMHPALQHHTRRAKRDPRRWNEACDYAINPLLLDAGLSLPHDVLVDPRFRGMSAEQIYNLREAEVQPQSDDQSKSEQNSGTDSNASGGDGNESGTPSVPESQGGIGQVIDAPETDDDMASIEEQERDWEIAVNQAAPLRVRQEIQEVSW
jgi:predicted metal-dependent peptidase